MGGGKKEVAKTKGFKSESGCPSEIMQGKRARAHTHTHQKTVKPQSGYRGRGLEKVGEACSIRVEACKPASSAVLVCTANREGKEGEELSF